MPYFLPMAAEKHFSVPEAEHGARLDAFLSHALGCGLRAAKRLVTAGCVRVDGKQRPAHHKILSGSLVHVRREDGPALVSLPRIIAANRDYVACDKPAGLHTACIEGLTGPTLESALRQGWHAGRDAVPAALPAPSFPEPLRRALGGGAMERTWPERGLPEAEPALLTRLDKDTSGIVLAAFSPAARELFREWEAAGSVDKYYIALVHGTLSAPLGIRNALDTANRKKTRVLETAAPDAARHTSAIPLPGMSILPGTTLVAVRIKRGARHQIRAHLSHAGYPILGDRLYGIPGDAHFLHLHHTRIVLPGFSAISPPPWLAPD